MDEVVNVMKTGVLCCDVHDAWGIEISATIYARKNDAISLTQFPRNISCDIRLNTKTGFYIIDYWWVLGQLHVLDGHLLQCPDLFWELVKLRSRLRYRRLEYVG